MADAAEIKHDANHPSQLTGFATPYLPTKEEWIKASSYVPVALRLAHLCSEKSELDLFIAIQSLVSDNELLTLVEDVNSNLDLLRSVIRTLEDGQTKILTALATFKVEGA